MPHFHPLPGSHRASPRTQPLSLSELPLPAIKWVSQFWGLKGCCAELNKPHFVEGVAQNRCPISAGRGGSVWPALPTHSGPVSTRGVLGWEAAARPGAPFSGPFAPTWGLPSSSRQWNVRGAWPAASRQEDRELGAPSWVTVPVCWLNEEAAEILKAAEPQGGGSLGAQRHAAGCPTAPPASDRTEGEVHFHRPSQRHKGRCLSGQLVLSLSFP